MVGAYFIAGAIVATFYGLPYSFGPSFKSYSFIIGLLLLAALCIHAIRVMIFVRPDRLTRYLICSLKPFLEMPRLLAAGTVLLLIPVFGSTFTFFKNAIPALNPYSWDAVFTEWDAMMHGSIHPWVLLQPVLGYPVVTSGINFLYALWLFIMYGLLAMQAFDNSNPALRMRFLLSFVLSWIILGTFGAIVFSSMGPCFDAGIASNTGPYAPLMGYLKETSESFPVWALNLQQFLWESYQHNKAGMGSGISAMPSMHVAMAVLMALFGWEYSRPAGIALTAYALVIFIGSIHLAWHYALDGYAGAIGAWIIWKLVGFWQASRRLEQH